MDVQTQLPPLIRPGKLADFYGVSRASLYRWVNAGEHAPPIRLSRGASAFDRNDVIEFLQRRAAVAAEG